MKDMTLRDYMAAKALVGLGTKNLDPVSFVLTDEECLVKRANWAYRQADAMLEERKKYINERSRKQCQKTKPMTRQEWIGKLWHNKD